MTKVDKPKRLAPGRIRVLTNYIDETVHVEHKGQLISVDVKHWRKIAENMRLDFTDALDPAKKTLLGRMLPKMVEKHNVLTALWQYKNKTFPVSILDGMDLIG